MTILTESNPGKKLEMKVDNKTFVRYPVKTPTINVGDDLIALIKNELGGKVENGDVILIAESVISISEKRAYKISEIKTGFWAKFFSKFVTRTPAGIGLGMPETMQLALNEVGFWRIFIAAGVSAVSRPFKRGLFYKIAGEKARGIDGPTPNTLPPFNEYATLIPANPEEFAKKAEEALGNQVTVIVVDANDLEQNVLGARDEDEEYLGLALCSDNPMGQGSESTPLLLCRLKE